MSRVWRRFFLKVGKTVAIVVGLCSYIGILVLLLSMFGVNPRFFGMLIMLVGFGVPMTVFYLYTTYKDAEYEVKSENREILNKIKG